MIMAKVVGNIVSTIKHATHEGLKLMVIQPVDTLGKVTGKEVIAADMACAGEGDFVLCINEGGASKMVISEDSQVIIDAVIVGVLDNPL